MSKMSFSASCVLLQSTRISTCSPERERTHTHLRVAVVTKDWVCSVSEETKGLCWGAGGSGMRAVLGGCGQWNACPGCEGAVGVGCAVLLGLGGGTRRVARALQLQPCHPLTGHSSDTSHGAVLQNTTICLSLLTQGLQALHKNCWSPPLFWGTKLLSPLWQKVLNRT